MAKVRVTESLDIDLVSEKWCCHACGEPMESARKPFTIGSLVYEKPAREIYGDPIALPDETIVSYSPDPDFMRIVEYYCPTCGSLLAVHYLPPGHPIPVDIKLDIDKLKERQSKEAETKK